MLLIELHNEIRCRFAPLSPPQQDLFRWPNLQLAASKLSTIHLIQCRNNLSQAFPRKSMPALLGFLHSPLLFRYQACPILHQI